MHAAASGRFFISGPAVAFSTTFERMRTTMAEFLLDTGRSSSGLPHWTVNQDAIVRDYRHIHPWLIHVHEDDHVQLVSSTPVGVFLAKLHSFQVGRLHYMAAKLSRKVEGLLHVKPPFFRWFYEFASSRIGSNPDDLFSPQFDADPDWKHCRDVLIEIETYRVRYLGEQHVREDLGRIPTAQDWLLQIRPQRWMYGQALEKGESTKKEGV